MGRGRGRKLTEGRERCVSHDPAGLCCMSLFFTTGCTRRQSSVQLRAAGVSTQEQQTSSPFVIHSRVATLIRSPTVQTLPPSHKWLCFVLFFYSFVWASLAGRLFLELTETPVFNQSIDPVYELLRKAVDAGRRPQSGQGSSAGHEKPFSSNADRNWSNVIGQMGILPSSSSSHHASPSYAATSARARSSASSSGSSSCASAHLLSVLTKQPSTSGTDHHLLTLSCPFARLQSSSFLWWHTLTDAFWVRVIAPGAHFASFARSFTRSLIVCLRRSLLDLLSFACR